MTRIFGILIAVLFLSVGHTASAQGLLNRALAAIGNADAQNNLGVAYYNGEGVEQDFVEAVKWYRLAAEQGNADAQYNLGVAYDVGEGVEQDFVESVKWYRLAAEQGNVFAQTALGVAYYNGEGVEKDSEWWAEAVKWWQIAADQGHADAQNNLGVAYYNGKGVEQDFVYAHMWYNIAASLGNAIAAEGIDAVANEMTPEQIAEAQKLARECVRKEYKDC